MPEADDADSVRVFVDCEEDQIIARKRSPHLVTFRKAFRGEVVPLGHVLETIDHVPDLLKPAAGVHRRLAGDGDLSSLRADGIQRGVAEYDGVVHRFSFKPNSSAIFLMAVLAGCVRPALISSMLRSSIARLLASSA